MASANANERSQISSIAALDRWALHCTDRQAATAPARKAFADRFVKLVDPDGTLPPAERAARADAAKSAHFRRMARASAAKRKKGRAA
jgi:hypothetical protein